MIFPKKLFRFFIFIFITAIVYYLYATYSNYYQGVRAAESYKYGRTISTATVEYFLKYKKYPNSIDDLKLEKPEPSYAGQIGIDKQTGIINIQLAGNSLEEGVLIFSPQTTKDGRFSYTCQPSNVPIKYVQKECVT